MHHRRLPLFACVALASMLFACEDEGPNRIGGMIDGGDDGYVIPPDRGMASDRGAGGDDGGPEGDADPDDDGGIDPDGGGMIVREDAGVDADIAPDAQPDGAIEPMPCIDDDIEPCGDCEDGYRVCAGGAWGDCLPPLEVCSGRDDDCDGAVDEGFSLGDACEVGVGACISPGRLACAGLNDTACVVDDPIEPEDEGCNGIDDDCDGIIDEDFGGGGPCETGVGTCAASSVFICQEDQLVCVAEAEAPRDERCDGFDDDCDGAVDEVFDLGTPCTVGVGACAVEGLRACGVAGNGVCSAVAGEAGDELCNSLDDDCDGNTDEDVGGGMPCEVGVGQCVRAGLTACDADGGLACDVEPGRPEAEICNGLDDDCDDAIDEAFPIGDACAVGVGVCAREARLVCGDDGVRCPVEPGAPAVEACNGLDDDCDGETDEAFDVGTPCEVGVGACAARGRRICDGNGQARCDVEPGNIRDERCDGIDNDCDGTTDEGYALGEPCVSGEGECARDGELRCGPGGDAICGAPAGEPEFELCNGLDDDCDVRIDEELGLGDACTVGVGACERAGAKACSAEGGVICPAEPGAPEDEACNGVDDDCDDRTDEDFDLGTPCTVGVGACRATGTRICGDDGAGTCDARPGAPGDEVCNGLDDDCDGQTDEGFGLGDACEVGVGACERRGQVVCIDGAAGCSEAPGEPADELCNDADDDCDGDIDEDFPLFEPCESGVGQCLAGGILICDGVDAVCDAPPGEPGVEVCNTLDDDCDGAADEELGLGAPCGVGIGACAREGEVVCAPDETTTCSAVPGEPTDEACNAIDDDCDDETDEAFELDADCALGIGACRAEGRTICRADGRDTRCDAVPFEPSDEVCNEIDDDCDGPADEDLGLGERCSVGVGACTARGALICAGDGGTKCDVEPGLPQNESCNDIDDDCDTETDEDFDLGADCVLGLGICEADGEIICTADGGAVCDAEPEEAEPEVCDDTDNDCDGIVDEGEGELAGVPFGNCGPRYRSCLDALRQGQTRSGIYRISPVDGAGARVWCDQTTDGGGWTVVMSTSAAPVDQRADWHSDLQRLAPRNPRPGIWSGLAHLDEQAFDIRLACRTEAGAANAAFDVDTSFYGTPWYRGFIEGSDRQSCFAPANADALATPARRDNLSARIRANGQPYASAAGLAGETTCADDGDFTADFDDGGLAGQGLDGTDWGTVDGQGVCGDVTDDGQWLLFAREALDHPLGPIGLLGVHDLDVPIEAAGFEPILLDYDGEALRQQLDPETLPAIFMGRYAMDWDRFDGAVRTALACYGANGGNVVTEFDGISAVSWRYGPDFAFAEGAPQPLGWVRAEVGGGHERAIDTPITVIDHNDPITRGLGEVFTAGGGSERFVTLSPLHPTIPTDLATLGTFPGDGADFPERRYAALLRGVLCGGNLLVGLFDYADAPAHPSVARLVGNLAAAAISPVDPDLNELCGPIIGGGDACVAAPIDVP